MHCPTVGGLQFEKDLATDRAHKFLRYVEGLAIEADFPPRDLLHLNQACRLFHAVVSLLAVSSCELKQMAAS